MGAGTRMAGFQRTLLLAAALVAFPAALALAGEQAQDTEAGTGQPVFPVRVTLAPDQPIPYVYVDDPLIVELKALEDVVVSGYFEVFQDEEVHGPFTFEDIALRTQGAHWMAIEDLPRARGRYRVRAVVKADVGSSESAPEREVEARFCRIDRPKAIDGELVQVELSGNGRELLHAVRGIPADDVLVSADMPEVGSWLRENAEMGMEFYVRIDLGKQSDPVGSSAQLLEQLGAMVAGWQLIPSRDKAAFVRVVELLREAPRPLPITVASYDVENMEEALGSVTTSDVDAIACLEQSPSAEIVASFRLAAERLGYENPPLMVQGPGLGGEKDRLGSALLRGIVTDIAGGVQTALLDSGLIYGAEGFGPAYEFLTGLAAQLSGAHCVGQLRQPEPVVAHAFRKPDGWVLVLWNMDYARDIGIHVGDASGLALVDACANTLATPEATEGSVTLELGPEPVYLSGSGGTVLAEAARDAARREAKVLVGLLSEHEVVPDDFLDAVKSVADAEVELPPRDDFFALLLMFPRIESQWCQGALEQQTAAPTLAGLTRLVRHLCILEQEKGRAFNELLEVRLDKCEDYRTGYLTSIAPSKPSPRAQWLMAEMERRTQEALALVREGREIEANGVAAIAEWRGRSLAAHEAS